MRGLPAVHWCFHLYRNVGVSWSRLLWLLKYNVRVSNLCYFETIRLNMTSASLLILPELLLHLLDTWSIGAIVAILRLD